MGVYSKYEVYPSTYDEEYPCPFHHKCEECEYDCED